MKKYLVSVSAGLGLLALAGSANALTFNEAANTSFSQLFDITVNKPNFLVLSLSGSDSQFKNLSFNFLTVPGLAVSATDSKGNYSASFNDTRNNNFWLSTGTYLVKVSGATKPTVGTVSFTAVNGTITPVPEPGEWALMLSGLGILGMIARRRT